LKKRIDLAAKILGVLVSSISLISLLKDLKVEPFVNIGEWYGIMMKVTVVVFIISCIVLLWLYLRCRETDSKENKEKRG